MHRVVKEFRNSSPPGELYYWSRATSRGHRVKKSDTQLHVTRSAVITVGRLSYKQIDHDVCLVSSASSLYVNTEGTLNPAKTSNTNASLSFSVSLGCASEIIRWEFVTNLHDNNLIAVTQCQQHRWAWQHSCHSRVLLLKSDTQKRKNRLSGDNPCVTQTKLTRVDFALAVSYGKWSRLIYR